MKKFFAILILAAILVSLTAPALASGTSGEPDLTIAINSSDRNTDVTNFIRVVNQYMELTGKKVVVEIFSADEMTSKVNVELLASGGADLVHTAGLPFWEYAERGAFANIQELIEADADFNIDEYYANIIDPLRGENGNLYAFPCSFSFEFIAVNTELAAEAGVKIPEKWTLQNLIDSCVEFTKKTEGKQVFSHTTFGMDPFMDAMRREIMAAVDFTSKKSNLSEIDDDVYSYIFGKAEMSKNDQLAPGYMLTNLLYFPQTLALNSYTSAITYIIMEHDNFEYRNMPRSDYAAGQNLYTPQYAFSVNNAGNKQEAWEFIKFMLSAEVQNGGDEVGFDFITNPVNKAAYEYRRMCYIDQMRDRVQKIENSEPISGRVWDTKYSALELVPVLEGYLAVYEELRDNLNAAFLSDAVLQANIDAALASDATNVKNAKSEIVRIVSTYFGETAGDTAQGYTIIYIVGGVLAVGAVALVVLRVLKRRR